MHSHHSHSGDYVLHASDTLETIAQEAIKQGFETFCLTEHQPRLHSEYLYPEEVDKSYTPSNLEENYDNFYKHAIQLQQRYAQDSSVRTKFLVGIEVEGLDEEHLDECVRIINDKQLDLCVGSVHYVKGIPIDFDVALWNKAVSVCGGVRELFGEYFDLQYLMLTKVKPSVVGHFDLILLMCEDSVVDPESGVSVKTALNFRDWPEVWAKALRNIDFAVSYGALFELNSAAIRKGWKSPYPREDFATAIRDCGGKFCLSDDSHSITQVGLNYGKVLSYVKNVLQLQDLYYLDKDNGAVVVKSVSVQSLAQSEFFAKFSA